MKESVGSKIETAYLKLGAWIAGGIVLLIALGWGGHRLYRNWQEQHLGRQANEYLEKEDYRSAILTAQRALQLNPSNVGACRTIAQISERLGSRAAIDWRQRVVDLLPAVTEEKLAWAQTALRFNQPETAEIALDKIDPSQRSTAAFHDMTAQIALARNDAADAKVHAGEAIRLEPGNATYQLHLAIQQMRATDFAEIEQGRKVLGGLTKDPTSRGPAIRALIEDALRDFREQQAVGLARQLITFPEASFRDRLIYLRALRAARAPELDSEFEKLRAEAQKTPEAAADLLTWMNASDRADAAIAWANQLPAEITSKRPVPLALAYSYAILKDWRGLQERFKGAAWGEQDFLRLALLARALREQGDEAGFKAQWNSAMKKAPRGEQAMTLSQAVFEWGWKAEAIELMWGVNDNPAAEERALRALYAYYSKASDTSGLYRVFLHLHQIHPDDQDTANNVAQLSLLLNLDPQRGQKLARELAEKNPANPAYISTYAFSFYQKGDFKQALNVIRKLDDGQLQAPAVAAYYGLVLAAVGEHELALSFLDRGSQARLLPEESELVSKARRSIAP